MTAGEERVAFVTGGGSGLGRAICERLAREGMAVCVADRDERAAAETAGSLEGRALAVACDVTDLGSVAGAVAATIEGLGTPSVLVNNAGFDEPGPFLQTEPELWDRLVAVNLTGVLNCTYALAPHLIESARSSGYARIVNIASDAGRVGSLGEAVYSATKGGVIAFSKSIARELARDKVTVNAICPGPADTPMTDRIRASSDLGAKMMDRLVAATPLRRLVRAEEVAAAVSYLLGEDAGFVTGQTLSVSGGLTMD